jgi:hypothetical protein
MVKAVKAEWRGVTCTCKSSWERSRSRFLKRGTENKRVVEQVEKRGEYVNM